MQLTISATAIADDLVEVKRLEEGAVSPPATIDDISRFHWWKLPATVHISMA
jgi:hypothetical protein